MNDAPAANERLQVLVDSGTIRPTTRGGVLAVVEDLARRVPGDYAGDVGGMFVNHLAMAVERAHKGETVDPSAAPEASQRARTVAEQTLTALAERCQVRLPDTEVEYIAAYVDALAAEERS